MQQVRSNKQALKRIEAGKLLAPDTVRSYVEYENGRMVKVFCKQCHTQIAGEDAIAEVFTSKLSNGRVKEVHRMKFGNFSNYEVLEMEFDDGSCHQTPMCKICAKKVNFSNVEDLYAADLLQWNEDQEAGKGSTAWERVDTRVIKKFRIGAR